jgi:site-specific DNA-methyltransferase (adenine-specific)
LNATALRQKPAKPAARPRGTLLLGDCLEQLPLLVASGKDRFDLVYVDPPFNAGGQRGARLGSGDRGKGPRAYADSWGGLPAFLAMLEPRLLLMREVMSDEASLWLHLDHRAVHDAKVLLDRVFGRGAFRGEIIWIPGNGARRTQGPSVTHQTILVYTRGRQMIWNADDPALREPYAALSQRMHFRNVDAAGRRYRERRINGKAYRYYAESGRRLGSVWIDCPAMRANTPLVRETTGYPTQKPERLLERIVLAASRPESRVLDPMCGSGTTLIAAARHGRRWAGIDVSPLACRVARRRLARLT